MAKNVERECGRILLLYESYYQLNAKTKRSRRLCHRCELVSIIEKYFILRIIDRNKYFYFSQHDCPGACFCE